MRPKPLKKLVGIAGFSLIVGLAWILAVQIASNSVATAANSGRDHSSRNEPGPADVADERIVALIEELEDEASMSGTISGDRRVSRRQTIKVSGEHSQLTITGQVTIDGGAIAVLEGAKLQTSQHGMSSTRLASSGALAVVDGKGSEWTVSGRLEIGDGGEAHLTISDGAKVESGIKGDRTRISGAGGPNEAASTASVSGKGTCWVIGGDFEIGDSGEAHLSIKDGAKVESGIKGDRTRICGAGGPNEAASTASVSGKGTCWVIGGDFEIGDIGEAHLSISDGAKVESGIKENRTRISGAGGPNEAASTASVSGKGTCWVIGGDFEIGDSGEAHLSIKDGAKVSCGKGGRTRLVGAGGETASVTIKGPGSTWYVASDLQVGAFEEVTLTVRDSSQLDVDGIVRATSHSNITLDRGHIRTTSLNNEGWIRGIGVIHGNLSNRGTISPEGAIVIGGDYSQMANGIARIEILGSRDQIAAAKLVITGEAALGGTLAVSLHDGATVKAGHAVEVVSFRSRTGAFATLNLPKLSGGLGWSVVYTDRAVVLKVVSTKGE